MIHDRLLAVHDRLVGWCDRRGVVFDYVVDEDDLQSYLIPRAALESIDADDLAAYVGGAAAAAGVHFQSRMVRSGLVLCLSLSGISEGTMDSLVDKPSRFERRMSLAFGSGRGAGPTPVGPRPTSLADRLGYRLGLVSEDLGGIAADFQPMEVLSQFEQALNDVGLIKRLAAAGVSNGLSRDKQVIHFYVSDGEGQDREVLSFELVDLADGSTMEKAIKDLGDLARKRAPGTSEREAARIKERDNVIRQVAKQHSLADMTKQQDTPGAAGGSMQAGG